MTVLTPRQQEALRLAGYDTFTAQKQTSPTTAMGQKQACETISAETQALLGASCSTRIVESIGVPREILRGEKYQYIIQSNIYTMPTHSRGGASLHVWEYFSSDLLWQLTSSYFCQSTS